MTCRARVSETELEHEIRKAVFQYNSVEDHAAQLLHVMADPESYFVEEDE